MNSFIKDFFRNIGAALSESKFNCLKYDEYSKRQLSEYILLKNSKSSFAFSVIQLFIGILSLIITLVAHKSAQGEFLSITGSCILILSSLAFFVLYKNLWHSYLSCHQFF